MKYYFLLAPFLFSNSIFATDKEKQSDQLDIKQALLTTLIVFSVHDQAIINNTEQPPNNEPQKSVPTKARYKPQPKKQKYNRHKQTNKQIQQFRKR